METSNDDAGPPPSEYSPITRTPVITLLKGYVNTKSSAAWSLNAPIAGSNSCEPMPRGGSVAGLLYWFHRQQPAGSSGVGKPLTSRSLLLEVVGNRVVSADLLCLLVVRCASAKGTMHTARNKSRKNALRITRALRLELVCLFIGPDLRASSAFVFHR